MKKQYVSHILAIVAIVSLPFGAVLAVDTQIQTDGNLSGVSPLNVNAPPSNTVYPIQENNGQAAGNNLFYSFSQFNIGSGDTAYFNLTQNWNNVITRVTGGVVSLIDGTLRVSGSREVGGTPADAITGATTLTNAAKNFFFINPAGITFGPGSVVDVPGSFYASTASTLNFSDGSSYRADGTQPSGLSAATPASFGFLGNETGALTLDHAKVQVFNDETLALVGHDISIDSSTVGMVDLTTAQPAYTPLGLPSNTIFPARFIDRRPLFIDGIQMLLLANHSQTNVPIDTNAIKAGNAQLDGNITIKNTDLVNAGGDAEEITFVRGGNINLQNASIVSSNYGDDCGGFCGSFTGNEQVPGASGIDVQAKGALTLNNGHIVSETSFSPVNPAVDNIAINIQANSLLMDNGSTISSRSLNVGNITPSYIPAGIIPVLYPVNPQAGNININVGADFVAKGGSSVTSSTETFGNAGEIRLTAGSITLDNASIKSESLSNTNGLTGYVNDGHNSIYDPTRTQQDFYLNYNRSIPIQNQPNPYLNANPVLQTTQYNAGNAGKVSLTATNGDIKLSNASAVSTNIHSGTINSGAAAISLTSNTGSINIDGSTVSSTTSGDANAGDISLFSGGELKLLNNSKISTDSLGDASKLGNSGVITINSKDLTMNNGSLISSSTNSLGSAGTVTVNTDSLNIQGVSAIPIDQLGHYVDANFTGIRSTANAGSGGQTGFIDIMARRDVHLNNGTQISISNQANVADPHSLVPTHINILTPNLYMTNSQIVADSSGNVNAGDINITFSDWLYMDPSAISTSANNGNGGNIVINGGKMFWLQDSAITTSVLGLQGNGGDISIKSDYLIMDSGFIQANTAAQGAKGGLVNVDVGTIIPIGSLLFVGGNSPFKFQPYSGINVIQAAAPNGVKGQVTISSPQLNLSGTLANLIVQSFDQNVLSRELCAIGNSSSLSQSGKGGLRRRAKDALLSNSF